MNKNAFLIGVLLILFLLGLGLLSAVCDSKNTPIIKPINYFELAEDELFEYDFNLSNMDEENVSYNIAFLDRRLTGIYINNDGVMKFTPSSDDVGSARIGLIAVIEDCAYTLVITLKVWDRPEFTSYKPINSTVEINQTQHLDFSAKARDRDVNDSLTYEWFIDSDLFNESINETVFTFRPGYKYAGVHEISVRVTDTHNLSDTETWYVQISKVNRPPVLMFFIPGFILFKNTDAGAYNLNDYFADPDGGRLRFEYKQVNPAYELPGIVYANISVIIDRTGFITYSPMNNTKGRAYFVFTAYDILNLSTESNIVGVDVVTSDQFNDLRETSTTDFCGDYVCSLVEDCHTCPFDCGVCEEQDHVGCDPDWNCTEWSPCMPAGFMFRNCTDLNDCNDNRTKPDEIRQCDYNATCDDGLKNGIEEGVDCGGPCEPCPTCNDSIQNQGEGGVDCGGPCEPCPSCTDGLKNQNESDIDCGGPCSRCPGGKSCLKNKDCESLRCEYLVCSFPSCNDSIRNQGEEGIDCGGPCAKRCGTCFDGIQNGGELGVDCGGLCKPCPTCDDGIKNGDERLVDCGGECRKCTLNDYFQRFFVFFLILIIVIAVIPLGFVTYFFYLLANPERARGLYEHNTSFTFLIEMNRLFRKLRKKSLVIGEDVAKGFINELTELGKRLDVGDKEVYERVLRIYSAVLGLPEEFDDNIFNMKLRSSGIPLFLKILFAGFYKKAEILPLATYVAAEQKQDMIVELKFLISELVKG
ncbi:hypothetical protein AYK26_00810 [Euryarchaeota archaeon SM23-78]|nr:MAG: hypothetical protein AYK26_00810 [Euryarchaeota archaeon SM23-78]MBW3001115.1 hypothetical protein [Candidatus Woesearchaeota archaeon]